MATVALVVSLVALRDQRNQTKAAEAQVLPFIDVSYLARREKDGSLSEILAVSNYGAPLRDLGVDEAVFFDVTVGRPPDTHHVTFPVVGFRFGGQPYFRRSGLLYTLQTLGNESELADLSHALLRYGDKHGGVALLDVESFVRVSYLDTFGNAHDDYFKQGTPIPASKGERAFVREFKGPIEPQEFGALNVKRLVALAKRR